MHDVELPMDAKPSSDRCNTFDLVLLAWLCEGQTRRRVAVDCLTGDDDVHTAPSRGQDARCLVAMAGRPFIPILLSLFL